MCHRFYVYLTQKLQAPFSTIPLAIFRITYGIVLLGTILQLYAYKELIYDSVPFLSPSSLTIKLPLFFWLLNTVFLIVGILTKWVSVANFIFSLCLVYPLREFSYAFDSIMLSINAWMMIAPVGSRFSLDNVLFRSSRKYIPSFYVYLLLTIALIWVYLDAGIQKLLSPLWREGIAFWRYASNPAVSSLSANWLLDQQWICYTINYNVIAFQLTFPLLLLWKRFRWYVVIGGLSLHIGILVFFYIPLFSLTECLLYLFLVPQTFWRKWEKHPATPFSELPQRITSFFIFFQGYVAVFYIVIILQNPVLQKIFSPFLVVNKPLLGMVQHYLFIEELQQPTSYVYSIVYESEEGEFFLPLITEKGTPHRLLHDRLWSQWDYASHPRFFEEKKFRSLLQRQIVFWLVKTGKYDEKATYFFKIKRKPVIRRITWQKGLQEEYQKLVWEDYWKVTFSEGTFSYFP